MTTKPFYRFVGRRPRTDAATGFRLTDQLIWRNENEPHDKVSASEWWFWQLWRV